MSRSFCRQEAGAAGDDLPALPRRENVPLVRGRRKRGGGRATTEGMIERNGVAARGKRAGYIRSADTFVALKQPLISGGESRIQPPRICLHVPREGGEGGGDQGDERGMESMRSLYSARQKRLVRYTP